MTSEAECKNHMGEKVNGHCSYDEATLREDKVNPGFICPICWTHYDTIGESHGYGNGTGTGDVYGFGSVSNSLGLRGGKIVRGEG